MNTNLHQRGGLSVLLARQCTGTISNSTPVQRISWISVYSCSFVVNSPIDPTEQKATRPPLPLTRLIPLLRHNNTLAAGTDDPAGALPYLHPLAQPHSLLAQPLHHAVFPNPDRKDHIA